MKTKKVLAAGVGKKGASAPKKKGAFISVQDRSLGKMCKGGRMKKGK
jgi:hypothetical protein